MSATWIMIFSCVFLVAGAAALVAAWLVGRRAKVELAALADDKHKLLERLAAGLAHELKNPLGALNLNLQLLEEELVASGALPDESAKRLHVISSECRHLEEVLDNFLRYARKRTLELEEVSINSVVEEVLTFLRPETSRAGIEVRTHFDRMLPTSTADVALLKQALMNVILNAVDAMPEGGRLTVRTRALQGEVAIAFADTGDGVAVQALPHVFEAYFSTRKGGMGLGLAITRRILEAHGGSAVLDNPPGGGCTVTVTLPAFPRSK